MKCRDCDMISISVEMRDGCAVKFNSCIWMSHMDINVERECHHFDPKRVNLDEKTDRWHIGNLTNLLQLSDTIWL